MGICLYDDVFGQYIGSLLKYVLGEGWQIYFKKAKKKN